LIGGGATQRRRSPCCATGLCDPAEPGQPDHTP